MAAHYEWCVVDGALSMATTARRAGRYPQTRVGETTKAGPATRGLQYQACLPSFDDVSQWLCRLYAVCTHHLRGVLSGLNGSTSWHAWPPGVASMAWCTKHASHPTAYNTHRSVSGHHGAWGQVPKQSVCGAWCAQLTVEPHGAKCKKHPPAPQRPWGTTGHHCRLACTALRTRWTCELPLTPPLVNVRWAGNGVCRERDGWGGHHGMTICVQTWFAEEVLCLFLQRILHSKNPNHTTQHTRQTARAKHAPRAKVQHTRACACICMRICARAQFSIVLGTQI